jgi:hypothetical protein
MCAYHNKLARRIFMGFKELMKSKTFGEYLEAKKDPEIMKEIKQRTTGEVIKNIGKTANGQDSDSNWTYAFGFKLTKKEISKGKDSKSLSGVVARVESGSELQSRVTATRLLAFGVFAFAAKKKKGGEKYLTIEGPDFVWTAEVKRDKKDINKAMNFVSQINSNAKLVTSQSIDTNEPTADNNLSAADELKKFKELLDLGAITQEEFDTQKAKILG